MMHLRKPEHINYIKTREPMIESLAETLCNKETTSFGKLNLLSGKKERGMLGSNM